MPAKMFESPAVWNTCCKEYTLCLLTKIL